MKKLAILAIVALTALSLTGCVKMHTDTIIDKDGSGTASLTMSMSPTGAEIMEEMKELDMDEEQGMDMDMSMFDDIDKDDFTKAAEDHGVTVKKFDKGLVDGREQLDILLEFEDLKGLSYVLGSSMGAETGGGFGIFEAPDGNFILKSTRYDFPPEEIEEMEEIETAPGTDGGESSETSGMTEEEKAQKQMALMGKLMGAMAELDIRFAITVPGEVIESNAPTVEGNTSIWEINASNMMSQQGNQAEPVITFSSKGLDIKPLKE
ncbi:MAG: hypothetical protein ABFS42_12080 [Candidatus Krumholzibacteriota bacterium]